jgi:hypothetical protein
MIRKIAWIAIPFVAWPFMLSAQDCKLKFAVVYADGKDFQVGLTPEQKKLWDHDGTKKYKGMCIDAKAPDYLILWSDGLSGVELVKAGVDHFNVVRSTGQAPTTLDTNSSLSSRTIRIGTSQQVREKADYYILDTSKTPYAVVRQGQGYQDVPQGRTNQPGQSVKASDLASTIADPAAAMENALKWLKKEKKL